MVVFFICITSGKNIRSLCQILLWKWLRCFRVAQVITYRPSTWIVSSAFSVSIWWIIFKLND
jgi:hypothetical protein